MTITTEILEAAPLGTVLRRGIDSADDSRTEVVAVKAGLTSGHDTQPWMLHGSLWQAIGRRWMETDLLAARLPDDVRLATPPADDRDTPTTSAAADPLAEWLEQTESGGLRERLGDMKLSAILELVAHLNAALQDAERQRDLHQAHFQALTILRTRIERACTID